MGRIALLLGLGLVAANLVLTGRGQQLLAALGLAPAPPSSETGGGGGGNFTAASRQPPLNNAPTQSGSVGATGGGGFTP